MSNQSSSNSPGSVLDSAQVPVQQTQQSPAGPSPTAAQNSLITVSPTLLKFDLNDKDVDDGSCTKTISITNLTNCRLAFRVLSNWPKRYVVNPGKGFLTAQETYTVKIVLMEPDKYHLRHAFVIQAKRVLDHETDRKITWMTELSSQQNVRVATDLVKEGSAPPQTAPTECKKNSETTVNVGDSDTNLRTDSTHSTMTSPSSPSSNASSSTSTGSLPGAQIDHGEFQQKVNEINAEVCKAIDEKNEKTRLLVNYVNDVKKLEVELDRANNTYNDFSTRCSKAEYTQIELQARLKIVQDEIQSLKKQDSSVRFSQAEAPF